MFESIVKDVHVGEAGVAVKLEFLSGEVEFWFENFLIAVAAYFPAESTDIDKFTVDERHFADELTVVVNDLSFPDDPYGIIAFFALEFDPEFELFPLFCVEEIHQKFGAVALDVEQNFFKYEVGAVLHDEGIDGDFVV